VGENEILYLIDPIPMMDENTNERILIEENASERRNTQATQP
jgi:hypothetical protein